MDSPATYKSPEVMEENVGKRVSHGATLMLATRMGLKVLSLGVVAIQARLLFPEDFAILSIAMGVIVLTDALSNLQVVEALVRIKVLTADYLNTAFSLNVMRALLVAAILAAVAPYIADAMREPRLASVLLVLALLPLIDSIRSPAMVKFERNIDFGRENTVRIVQTLSGWAITIALAFWLRNYWALVIGTLGGRFISVVVTYYLAPIRPGFSLAHWRELFGFSSWQMGTSILGTFNQRAESFVIGRMLGMPLLGSYEMGNNLAATATDEFASTLAKAIYPGFVRHAEDLNRLRQSYLEAQAVTFGMVAPMGIGLALVAPEFVRVVAGTNWSHTVPFVQVVAPLLALTALFGNFQPLMMALNQTRKMFLVPAIMVPVRLSLFVAGIMMFGLPGFLGARVLEGLLYMGLVLSLVGKALGVRLKDYIVVAWRSGVAVAVMAASLFLLNAAIPFGSINPLSGLLSKTLLGALIYGASLLALWKLAGSPRHGIEYRALEVLQQIAVRIRNRSTS